MVAALVVVAALNASPPGNAARCRGIRIQQRSQQGGLSRAVGADNGNFISALDGKIGVGKQNTAMFPCPDRHGQILDGQNILDRFAFKL